MLELVEANLRSSYINRCSKENKSYERFLLILCTEKRHYFTIHLPPSKQKQKRNLSSLKGNKHCFNKQIRVRMTINLVYLCHSTYVAAGHLTLGRRLKPEKSVVSELFYLCVSFNQSVFCPRETDRTSTAFCTKGVAQCLVHS